MSQSLPSRTDMPLFTTLFSGSGGNAALLSDGKTHILIDAGVSARRLVAALCEFDINAADLSAILITHEHGDHVGGLQVLTKYTRAPVYMSEYTAYGAERRRVCARNITVAEEHIPFDVGGITVTPIPTPHDTQGSVGYIFNIGTHKLGYFTDLGRITPVVRDAVRGTECLFIESNHDIERLTYGPYPEYLKLRILSAKGHLSNDACGDLICEAVEWDIRSLTLCHLSKENNTPELADTTAKAALERMGAKHVTLSVAPPDRAGEVYVF